MEDMERYGDYNEIDEPPSRGRKLLILKIVAAVVCFSVVAVLGLRIILFNYYPTVAKTLYFDQTLTRHYNEQGANIRVFTQNIRSEYDDNEEGNIFCNHLFVIKEANQLQISLKFNKSVNGNLKSKLGGDFDVMSGKVFTFRLVRDNPNEEKKDTFAPECVLGELTVVKFDTFMQYGYYKLVFNGVDFDGEAFDGQKPTWIRLETFVDDGSGVCKSENAFTVNLIYEDHEQYNKFDVYQPSKSEVPKK